MADIHIYVQDAFQEARNLQLRADELDQDYKRLTEQAEELLSVWRGASAQRVAAAMLGRAKDAQMLNNNLTVISDGLYRTALVYQQAQQPGTPSARVGPAATTAKKPGIHINIRFGSSVSTSGSAGSGHSSGAGRHSGGGGGKGW